jgi:hypothetical protein
VFKLLVIICAVAALILLGLGVYFLCKMAGLMEDKANPPATEPPKVQ